jgi:uncharacterized protein YbbC (DUF1343 family)
LEVTDPAAYDPAQTGVALLVEARRLSGDRWAWADDHFDRLAGTNRLRIGVEEGRSWTELVSEWEAQLEDFEEIRRPFLLYP